VSDFVRWPGAQVITGKTVDVSGEKIRIGLTDAGDLQVTDDTDDLAILPAGQSGTTALYDIVMNERARALKGKVKAKIYATNDLSKPAAATFDLTMQLAGGKPGPAQHLQVRRVTKDLYGSDQLIFRLGSPMFVNTTTYRPSDYRQTLDFAPRAAGNVRVELFAAKYGASDRTYWLMSPESGHAESLMIIITHTLGQGHSWSLYHDLGFENAFSVKFLTFMRDYFIFGRWGRQVAAAAPKMAMLLPVRAADGGSSLGPFVDTKGVGGAIINEIALSALGRMFSEINVCTFSSGVYDCITFMNNCGLAVGLGVNQDPAKGVTLDHGARKRQYLSGYTTGGPRPGFDYLPEGRWVNDPEYAAQKRRLGGEYCHTWSIPNYTLAMALSS